MLGLFILLYFVIISGWSADESSAIWTSSAVLLFFFYVVYPVAKDRYGWTTITTMSALVQSTPSDESNQTTVMNQSYGAVDHTPAVGAANCEGGSWWCPPATGLVTLESSERDIRVKGNADTQTLVKEWAAQAEGISVKGKAANEALRRELAAQMTQLKAAGEADKAKLRNQLSAQADEIRARGYADNPALGRERASPAVVVQVVADVDQEAHVQKLVAQTEEIKTLKTRLQETTKANEVLLKKQQQKLESQKQEAKAEKRKLKSALAEARKQAADAATARENATPEAAVVQLSGNSSAADSNSNSPGLDDQMQLDLKSLGLKVEDFKFGRRVYQCEIPAPGLGYRNSPSFPDKVPGDGAGPQMPQVIIADAIVQGPKAAFVRCCSGRGWLPLTDPNGKRICLRHLDMENKINFERMGLEIASGEPSIPQRKSDYAEVSKIRELKTTKVRFDMSSEQV